MRFATCLSRLYVPSMEHGRQVPGTVGRRSPHPTGFAQPTVQSGNEKFSHKSTQINVTESKIVNDGKSISSDLRLFAFICGKKIKKIVPIPNDSQIPGIVLILLLCALSALQPIRAQAEPTAPTTVESSAPLERLSERGPVTVRVTLDPAKPRIGDPLTLRLEVTAEAGVELLMPEFGQSLDRFAIRDFVPRETIDGDGRTLATQRYVLNAPMSGPRYIPPLAIEFVDRRAGMRPAPEGEDAYEVLTERLDFEVRSVLPEEADDEALEPPLGALAPLGAPGAANPWYWLLILPVLLAATIGVRFWLVSRTKVRRASAHERASARLKALMARPRPEGAETVDTFFVELSDLIRHYLEDRFGLHAPELTTEEFLDVAAGSPDLSRAHQGFLRDFLRRADQVKFARYLPDADYIEEVLDAAGHFLEQTRTAREPGERAMPRTRDSIPSS